MRLTKNDMARVIVQALYNRPSLPPVDNAEVVKRAKRGTVVSLTHQHKMAIAAINSSVGGNAAGARRFAAVIPQSSLLSKGGRAA